jgi:hypothetical protein
MDQTPFLETLPLLAVGAEPHGVFKGAPEALVEERQIQLLALQLRAREILVPLVAVVATMLPVVVVQAVPAKLARVVEAQGLHLQ